MTSTHTAEAIQIQIHQWTLEGRNVNYCIYADACTTWLWPYIPFSVANMYELNRSSIETNFINAVLCLYLGVKRSDGTFIRRHHSHSDVFVLLLTSEASVCKRGSRKCVLYVGFFSFYTRCRISAHMIANVSCFASVCENCCLQIKAAPQKPVPQCCTLSRSIHVHVSLKTPST